MVPNLRFIGLCDRGTLRRVRLCLTTPMQVLARACGHKNLSDFNYKDITTWKREMAELSGIKFAGVMR